MALVTVAPRDGVRDTPREHRSPSTLPAEVQALREAWNKLVAPHGFQAWGERTSGRLLEDAQAALGRRPLEEWRQIFPLVPRAPVCRGELNSRQRASLVWILAGICDDGYRPEEKLLIGMWSLDPEPTQTPADDGLRERRAAATRLEDRASDDSLAGRHWHSALEAVHQEGKEYALQWLTRMRAVGVEDEGVLVLECPDRFFRDWVDDHYRELMQRHITAQGLAGLRYVLAEDMGGAQ